MKIFLDTGVGFCYIKITVRACTGFDRPAEDGEAIRGLWPRKNADFKLNADNKELAYAA